MVRFFQRLVGSKTQRPGRVVPLDDASRLLFAFWTIHRAKARFSGGMAQSLLARGRLAQARAGARGAFAAWQSERAMERELLALPRNVLVSLWGEPVTE